MCFKPTEEETARSEARRAFDRIPREPQETRDPGSYPEPRGNQDADGPEVERSRERLTAVLGH